MGEIVYNQLVTRMKKSLFICLAALMVLAVSCKKDPKDPIAPDDDNTFPVPEAVDLGTVVNGKNVKWASFNLGASTEYEYGKYYAWGELEPKSNYIWTNYAHGGSGDLIIKYSPDTEEGAHRWDFDKKPDGPDGLVTLFDDNEYQKYRQCILTMSELANQWIIIEK